MLSSFNITDLLITLVLVSSVPFLVQRYLPPTNFSSDYRLLVALGGIAWLIFAFFHETFASVVLGVEQVDAIYHRSMGEMLAKYAESGRWHLFWKNAGIGNQAYHAYMGLMFAFTGVSPIGIVAINAFFAYWGGLILVHHLTLQVPFARKNTVSHIVLIFFPSVVFWTTANLKEGFMYWAICAFYTAMMTGGRHRISAQTLLLGIVAAVVGALFRPHVMLAWTVACLCGSTMLNKRKSYALVLLLALPLLFKALQGLVPVEANPESLLEKLQYQQEVLSKVKAGSNIEYGESGPIFFVSGFTAIFLRPFPWKLHSARYAICAVETWGLTLSLIFVWLRMNRHEQRKVLLGSPEVVTAIVACLGFSVAFSFIPNEGLVARQRVQVLPALLMLLYVPIVWRSFFRELVRRQRRGLQYMALKHPPPLGNSEYKAPRK